MSLRIACDLDGTVADLESALQREAERLFGSDVDVRANRRLVFAARLAVETPLEETVTVPSASAAMTKRPLTRVEQRRLWMHVCAIEDFWTTLGEIETGSIARLGALAAQHAWEVLFLTKRPATIGATPQVQTQRWLQARGFDMPAVFVVKGSRGPVADALALDVVVDDLPEHALDVATTTKARAILVWRETASRLSPRAAHVSTVVASFGEALDVLEQMTGPASRTQRLMRRVRAAMGL
jgi:hypothetical protein